MTLDVGTWNIEWFGSPSHGPVDDSLQLVRAAAALESLEVDLWGLVEIVDPTDWEKLLNRLPEYTGVLATDAAVAGGSDAYYLEEQKPALLVRSGRAEILSARIVLPELDHAFAGRPPLEASVRTWIGVDTVDLTVLVVHMKAGADADDRVRRATAADALKRYLDTTHPESPVLVIGDFNDDVDVSIHPGSPTPYAAFVADTARWGFLTAALSEEGRSSTTGYPDMVDHQLGSDEARALYVSGSAAVVKLDDWIPSYDRTTSDHYPVVTALRLSNDY